MGFSPRGCFLLEYLGGVEWIIHLNSEPWQLCTTEKLYWCLTQLEIPFWCTDEGLDRDLRVAGSASESGVPLWNERHCCAKGVYGWGSLSLLELTTSPPQCVAPTLQPPTHSFSCLSWDVWFLCFLPLADWQTHTSLHPPVCAEIGWVWGILWLEDLKIERCASCLLNVLCNETPVNLKVCTWYWKSRNNGGSTTSTSAYEH